MPTNRRRLTPRPRPPTKVVSTILHQIILLELLYSSCVGLQVNSFLPCRPSGLHYETKTGPATALCEPSVRAHRKTTTILHLLSQSNKNKLDTSEEGAVNLRMQAAGQGNDPIHQPPPFPRPIPRGRPETPAEEERTFPFNGNGAPPPYKESHIAAVAMGANSPSTVRAGGLATAAANDIGETSRRIAAGYETEEMAAQRKRAMEWLNGQRSFDADPTSSSRSSFQAATAATMDTQRSARRRVVASSAYSSGGGASSSPPFSPYGTTTRNEASLQSPPLTRHQILKSREQPAEVPAGLMDALESDQDIVGGANHGTLSNSEYKSLIASETKNREWSKAEQLWQQYVEAFPSSSTYLDYARWCVEDRSNVELARSVYESMVPHLSAHDVRQPWVLMSWAAFEERYGQSERARIIRTELGRAVGAQNFRLDSILPKPVSVEARKDTEKRIESPDNHFKSEASVTVEPMASESVKMTESRAEDKEASRGGSFFFVYGESSKVQQDSVQGAASLSKPSGVPLSGVKETNKRHTSTPGKIDGTVVESTKEPRRSFQQSPSRDVKNHNDAAVETSRNPLTIAMGAAALLSAISFGTLFDAFRPSLPSNPVDVSNAGYETPKSILVRDPMDEDLDARAQKSTNKDEVSADEKLAETQNAAVGTADMAEGNPSSSVKGSSEAEPSSVSQQSTKSKLSEEDLHSTEMLDFWLRRAKPASNPAAGSEEGLQVLNLRDISTPVLPNGEIRSLDLSKVQGITVSRVDTPPTPGLSLASSVAPEILQEQEIADERANREEQLRLKVAEFERRELDLRRKIDEQKEIEAQEKVKLEELRRKEEELRQKAEERRLQEEARARKLEEDRQRKLQEERLIAAQQERIEQLRRQEESIRMKVEQQQKIEEELQERLESSLRAAEENARREELRLAEEKLKIAEQLQKRLEEERRLNEENANKKVELQAATQRLKKAEDLQRELEAQIQAAEDRARQEEAKAAEDKVRKEAELRLKEQELEKKLQEQQKLEVERQRKEEEIRLASEAKAQKEEELRIAVEKAKKEEELRRLREVELQNQREAQQREEARQKQLEEERQMEKQRKAEEARIALENSKREEAERLARDMAQKEEAERLARETVQKEEAERVAKETARKEAERAALEKMKKEEEARLAFEKAKFDEEVRMMLERARQEEASRTATAISLPSFQDGGISNDAANTLGIGVITGLGVAAVAAAGSKGPDESRERDNRPTDLPRTKPQTDIEATDEQDWPRKITRSPPEKPPRKLTGNNEGDALLQLVLFETRCGRIDRAEDAFKKYVKTFPSVSAYLRFADWAENDANNIKLARSVYESMLTELESEEVSQSVFQQWAEFEERQGEYERAQIILRGTVDIPDAEQPRAQGFSSDARVDQSFTQQSSQFNSYPGGSSSGGQQIVNDVLSAEPFGAESSYRGNYQPFSNRIPNAGVGGSFPPPSANTGSQGQRYGEKQAFPQQNSPSFNNGRNYQQMPGSGNMQSGASGNYQNPVPGSYTQGGATTYGPDLGNPAPTGLYDSSTVQQASNPVPINQSYQQAQPTQSPPAVAQSVQPPQVVPQTPQVAQTAQPPPVTAPTTPPAPSGGRNMAPPTFSASPTLETRMEQLNSEIRAKGSKSEVNESDDAVSLAQQALNLAEEAMQMTDSSSSPELAEEMTKAYEALSEMLADDLPSLPKGATKRNGVMKP